MFQSLRHSAASNMPACLSVLQRNALLEMQQEDLLIESALYIAQEEKGEPKTETPHPGALDTKHRTVRGVLAPTLSKTPKFSFKNLLPVVLQDLVTCGEGPSRDVI